LEKTIGYCDHLHLIWHGGEPLLVGSTFYREIIEIENEYSSRIKITNSIQSNGTLLNQEFASILYSAGFQIGFSFDGTTNDVTRGNTDLTLRGINIARLNNQRISIIKVMLKEDLDNIRSIYSYFKSMNADVKMNPLFRCELVSDGMLYNASQYVAAMRELFCEWICDDACSIRVDPLETYIALLTGKGNRDCSHGSCLTKFLSINHNGEVYPCSRYFPPDFSFGNISNIGSISDVFSSSGFIKIVSSAIERRKSCSEQCDYFQYCQGGCNHDAFIEGSIEETGFFSCLVFKGLFGYILDYFSSIDYHEIVNKRA